MFFQGRADHNIVIFIADVIFTFTQLLISRYIVPSAGLNWQLMVGLPKSK